MLGRRAKPGGGVTEQRKITFDHGHHAGTSISSPPKLLLAGSGASDEEEASPELAEAVVSLTCTLQAVAASLTPPATTCYSSSAAVPPFSRNGSRRSQRHRPWEARPVRLGLAGALNGEAPGATTMVLTGQRLRPVQTTNAPCSPSSSPSPSASKEFGVKSCPIPAFADRSAQSSPRWCLSPSEMMASEDYTRVIARGPNPRTTHIFDDRVVVDNCGFTAVGAGSGEDEFLRWCHGCSKDLGEGKDIFMYRGEMAFCSHECRYREMLFDEEF